MREETENDILELDKLYKEQMEINTKNIKKRQKLFLENECIVENLRKQAAERNDEALNQDVDFPCNMVNNTFQNFEQTIPEIKDQKNLKVYKDQKFKERYYHTADIEYIFDDKD